MACTVIRSLLSCATGVCLAFMLAGCASTIVAPRVGSGPSAPLAGPCVATVRVDPPSNVFTLPVLNSETTPGRCNIEGMALATHIEGQFRSLYGETEQLLKPSTAIDPVIDDLKLQAQAHCASTQSGCVFRILIFAHGGLVTHQEAVLAAEAMAPSMMADGYAPVFL